MTFPHRWDYTLRLGDVFHDDDLTFPEKRDEIVRRIRALPLEGLTEDDAGYRADEIALTTDPDEFDEAWDRFYDLADDARIWVETWPSPKGADT